MDRAPQQGRGHGRLVCIALLRADISVEDPSLIRNGLWPQHTVSQGQYQTQLHNTTLKELAAQMTEHLFSLSSTGTSGLVVYLGKQAQEGVNHNQLTRHVTKIIQHPQYNNITNNNDIALILLSSSVTFTNYIRPVCLAGQGSSFPSGTQCWITGWGDIALGGNL